MRKLFATICVCFIIALSIIPCFATADGGAGQYAIESAIPWRSMTVENANGDNTTILDFSLSALSDTDNDGLREYTNSEILVDSKFSRVSRIVWRSRIIPLNDPFTWIWDTNSEFIIGNDYTNTFNRIELGYTGLWAINTNTGIERRVYTFETYSWWSEVEDYKAFNFLTGDLFQWEDIVPTNDTSYTTNEIKEWLEASTVKIYAYKNNDEWVTTQEAFTKHLPIEIMTDRNTYFDITTTELNTFIPSYWQTVTNKSTVKLYASNFIMPFKYEGVNNNPIIGTQEISIGVQGDDTFTISYQCKGGYGNRIIYEDASVVDYHQFNVSGTMDLQKGGIGEDRIQWYYGMAIPYNAIQDELPIGLDTNTQFVIDELIITIEYIDFRDQSDYVWQTHDGLYLSLYSTDQADNYGTTYDVNISISEYILSTWKDGYVEAPEESHYFDFITIIMRPLNAFLNVDIFGAFSIGDIMGTVLTIGIIFIVLKFFAGG